MTPKLSHENKALELGENSRRQFGEVVVVQVAEKGHTGYNASTVSEYISVGWLWFSVRPEVKSVWW